MFQAYNLVSVSVLVRIMFNKKSSYIQLLCCDQSIFIHIFPHTHHTLGHLGDELLIALLSGVGVKM